MLTEQQYSDVVFTAMRANAALTQSLRSKEALGCYPDWSLVSCQDLKIESGMWSLEIGDFTSEASVDIYNQLLDIGSTWSGGIAFDPNAQIPGIIINVTNTNALPFAGDIPWINFDPGTEQPDNGRYIWYEPLIKGYFVQVSLLYPQETGLINGIDYVLLSGGGIQLLPPPGGNPGFIYPGQYLRVTAFPVQSSTGGGGSQPVTYFAVSFTSVSSLTINWQTDIPPGQISTYSQIFGQVVPNPEVYILPDPISSPNDYQQIPVNLTYTTDGSENVLTVTLDWSIVQTGRIVF